MSDITAERVAELANRLWPSWPPPQPGPRVVDGWIELPGGGWRKLVAGYAPPKPKQVQPAGSGLWKGWNP
jgi:hypothetical protein